MSRGNDAARALSWLKDVDPERLSREELVDLVYEIQKVTGANTGSPEPGGGETPTAALGADYTIVFDGGSLGNPGRGYGSYHIVTPKSSLVAQRLEFGDRMTNNQAEFRALIDALEMLLEVVGPAAGSASVAIRGDSQLVIRGLSGEWRIKNPGLQPLHRQATDLLGKFGKTVLTWQPRSESYRVLGH